MTRKALVVGIKDYKGGMPPLRHCVEDAKAVAELLERHGNKDPYNPENNDPNFTTRLLAHKAKMIDAQLLSDNIAKLFSGEAEVALFYFSGHGLLDPYTRRGHLVVQNGQAGAWGIPLSDLLDLANAAYPRIRSTILILDCCHAGAAALDAAGASVIGPGVTILAASRDGESASEGAGEHSVFTEILLDGLRGGGADILGDVTPASLYAHLDQSLGVWEQRPVYKANVQNFVSLRRVKPRVPLSILQHLPKYFPDPKKPHALDPSYEEDRVNVPHLAHISINPEKVKIFKELQRCNRHGLVLPVKYENMYHEAINSGACKLTPLGAHYHRLALLGRF